MTNEPAGGETLPATFYACDDVAAVSRRLIGKVLCNSRNGIVTSGVITETEAYCGRGDRACHANDGLRTSRTEVMYGPPGHAYVYLCYGIHHLFNIVTNRKGMADAVLIRSIRPLDGLSAICRRRNMQPEEPNLANGPGKLTRALAITTEDNGTDLNRGRIWLEERGIQIPDSRIEATPRIGVSYAGEDANRPWRFTLAGPFDF